MSHRITRLAMMVLLLAGTHQAMALCQTQQTGFSTSYRGGIGDLNDYGAIQMDSDNGGGWPDDCAKLAHDALLAKLKNTPNSAFQQSLAGYNVAMIFAAAQRIAAFGWFNTATDPATSLDTLAGQLNRVMGAYQVVSHAGGCGTGFEGNSCMDDHAGAAAAYGWITAYKKKRGDTDTSTYASTTHTYVNNFFSNACIHNPSTFNGTAVCNGTVSDLGGVNLTGPGKVISFEHDIQTPHYGLGLMTSIASAIMAVEAAGASITLSTNQQIVARAIFREVQDHTDSNFAFKNDCEDPYKYNGVWYFSSTKVPCKDFSDVNGRGYDPRMYHLQEFFDDKVGGRPTGTYQSDDNCCSSYPYWDVNNFSSEWGAGRYATYQDQGWKWYEVRGTQSRYMPFNLNAAKGYLDGVGNDGVATGWACDPDAPDSWVKIDLYSNGYKVADDHTSQYAWWGSESAVNQLCGGGSAHRFYIQLPSWTYGQAITAKARDFTTGGDVTLPCLESPNCSW